MRDESLIDDDELDVSDKDAATSGLVYPFDDVPPHGEVREVAPGVHWLRMPLPFALDHINLWLIDDGNAVVIVDTGVAMGEIKKHWTRIFDEVIGARPVSRIIVTHFHPDHIGLAGWLHERTGAPLLITRTEYLMARMLSLDVRPEPPEDALSFFRAAGFNEADIERQRRRGWGNYAKGVSALPVSYRRLKDGDVLEIGGHAWHVVVGCGHAPEHACLHAPALGVMIAGDQVLPRISSNVSVHATEPEANPLGDWLSSLDRLKALPEDTLVLPAHNEPFYGLHARLEGLIKGHLAKLERLTRTLGEPRKATETLNTLFGRKFDDAMLMSMATGESLAHLRFLESVGVVQRSRENGVDRYARNGDAAVGREDLRRMAGIG